MVDLFELSEPEDNATQTLRIKDNADLGFIATSITAIVSVSAHTAFDETGGDVDILVFPEQPADGIRLRVRVYLEGALE